jgi:N-acetylmuramoyl-L-alanine amidase
MQEENLNNSIILATEIQNNFTNNLKRNSRGIKQQPLWVLDAAYMPSVLIELGFLSNRAEGEFLNSEEGQNKMARQIANAILNYRNRYFGEGLNSKTQNSQIETVSLKKETKENLMTVNSNNGTIYKVQLFANSKKLQFNSNKFKGLKDISSTFVNSLYKYMYGETSNLEEAKKMQVEARNIGFSDAFVIVINDVKAR